MRQKGLKVISKLKELERNTTYGLPSIICQSHLIFNAKRQKIFAQWLTEARAKNLSMAVTLQCLSLLVFNPVSHLTTLILIHSLTTHPWGLLSSPSIPSPSREARRSPWGITMPHEFVKALRQGDTGLSNISQQVENKFESTCLSPKISAYEF